MSTTDFISVFESGLIHAFDYDTLEVPTRFNYPHYSKFHPIALQAANDLQIYLDLKHKAQGVNSNWQHGKMLGVLVVRSGSQLKYLAAFSGALKYESNLPGFVPPVFDVQNKDGFFIEGVDKLTDLTDRIQKLSIDTAYLQLEQEVNILKLRCKSDLKTEKERLKKAKELRGAIRDQLKSTDLEKLSQTLKIHQQESLNQKFYYKSLKDYYEDKIQQEESRLNKYKVEIDRLKRERKGLSQRLQRSIFDAFSFLNAKAESKSLSDLFITQPPGGAGECAAPKLLQYAYQNDLEPISMAEFWWGKSPATEFRKHAHFYAACNRKCKPILKHMLEGLKVEPNPVLEKKEISLIIEYEDDSIIIVNKPSHLLSVPGKSKLDSVFSLLQERFPSYEELTLAHRLDMDTSGVLLVAKNKEVYRQLQKQFINRTVKKRYCAILKGSIEKERGRIELPLRVDLDDRPRQMVCFEHGKSAITEWEKISCTDEYTRVNFYPLTGKTHQLRVHAAHDLGLNASIVGDALYGLEPEQRLMLHAEYIRFVHPETGNLFEFSIPAPF